jgi:hypothetical protein
MNHRNSIVYDFLFKAVVSIPAWRIDVGQHSSVFPFDGMGQQGL